MGNLPGSLLPLLFGPYGLGVLAVIATGAVIGRGHKWVEAIANWRVDMVQLANDKARIAGELLLNQERLALVRELLPRLPVRDQQVILATVLSEVSGGGRDTLSRPVRKPPLSARGKKPVTPEADDVSSALMAALEQHRAEA